MSQEFRTIAAQLALPVVIYLGKRVIDGVSHLAGWQRAKDFETRIELYQKMLRAAQDHLLRDQILHALEREIRLFLPPLEEPASARKAFIAGRSNWYRYVFYVLMAGAVVMFCANAITFQFPELSPLYVAMVLALIVSAVVVGFTHEALSIKFALFFLVAVVVFGLAFAFAGVIANIVGASGSVTVRPSA